MGITVESGPTRIARLDTGLWIPGRGAKEKSFGTADTSSGAP
ncbi:hypothetical protein AB0D97_31750 [Streptomyces roseus]